MKKISLVIAILALMTAWLSQVPVEARGLTQDPYAPAVDRIDPSEGPEGTWVTIWGKNFGNPGNVEFSCPGQNGVPCGPTFSAGYSQWSQNWIVAEVPSGAFSYQPYATSLPYVVYVNTSQAKKSNGIGFKVTKPMPIPIPTSTPTKTPAAYPFCQPTDGWQFDGRIAGGATNKKLLVSAGGPANLFFVGGRGLNGLTVGWGGDQFTGRTGWVVNDYYYFTPALQIVGAGAYGNRLFVMVRVQEGGSYVYKILDLIYQSGWTAPVWYDTDALRPLGSDPGSASFFVDMDGIGHWVYTQQTANFVVYRRADLTTGKPPVWSNPTGVDQNISNLSVWSRGLAFVVITGTKIENGLPVTYFYRSRDGMRSLSGARLFGGASTKRPVLLGINKTGGTSLKHGSPSGYFENELFVVVAEDATNRIVSTATNTSGDSWSPTQIVSQNRATDFVGFLGGDGNSTIVFDTYEGAPKGSVFARTSVDYGRTWNAATELVSGNCQNVNNESPAVVRFFDEVIVAYESDRNRPPEKWEVLTAVKSLLKPPPPTATPTSTATPTPTKTATPTPINTPVVCQKPTAVVRIDNVGGSIKISGAVKAEIALFVGKGFTPNLTDADEKLQAEMQQQTESGKVKLVFLHQKTSETWRWQEYQVEPKQWEWALLLWVGVNNCQHSFADYSWQKFSSPPQPAQIYQLYFPSINR